MTSKTEEIKLRLWYAVNCSMALAVMGLAVVLIWAYEKHAII